jgi:hypothetical protein
MGDVKKPRGKSFGSGQPVPKSAGRPPLSPEAKAIRSLTTEEYVKIVGTMMHFNDQQIHIVANGEEFTQIEKIVASVLLKAREYGDPNRVEVLFQRLLGPVKQIIETKQDIRTEIEYTADWGTVERKEDKA